MERDDCGEATRCVTVFPLTREHDRQLRALTDEEYEVVARELAAKLGEILDKKAAT